MGRAPSKWVSALQPGTAAAQQSGNGPASPPSQIARGGSQCAQREPREGPMSDVAKPAAKTYDSFAEFYPFYLSEHADRTCRRLHFAGSALALLCLVALIVTRNPWWLLAGFA